MAVFGWFVHYVLIMVILAAVEVAGVFAGRKWAEKSKAKKDTAASEMPEKNNAVVTLQKDRA